MFLAGILQPDGRFNPTLQHDRIQWDGRRGQYILATAEQSTTGKPNCCDTRRRAQHSAGQSGTLRRNQAVDESGQAYQRRSHCAGRGIWQLYRSQICHDFGAHPDCALDKVTAVGNAAGDGARIALLNRHKRLRRSVISEWVTYVETAVHPDFQEEFVGAIHLPHASDAFPNLNGILPESVPIARTNGNGRANRKRKRRRKKLSTKFTSLKS